MSTSSTSYALIGADADAVTRADGVIAGLGLPADGIEIEDPATAERIAFIEDMDVGGALQEVATAQEAGRSWARTTPRQRADVLHAWHALLVARTEDLAHLISREMGKPVAEARAEVKYGSDFVRWYAEEAVRPAGAFREAPDGGASIVTRRGPVGLAVLITPWNFPLAMATRKIAPALAAGCAAVIKPANLTPLTTIFAVELARQAGMPADLVRAISIGLSVAPSRQSCVMAVSLALPRIGSTSKMASPTRSLNGWPCDLAPSPLGAGLSPGTELGPLIDDRAVRQMRVLTEGAVADGAKLLTGGAELGSAGHFFAPTVLDHVPENAEVACTEIFGPIAAIQRFDSQAEVIARANATEFGLAGYVFSENIDRALNVADQLETGLVGINQGVPSNAAAPFGGVKQSGLGREGSGEGLEEYQSVRFYNIARRETH